ncbi:MAG: hypothetical protein JOY59_05255, partial [Candidatus Eremiobacteraeota bacterium]|nr:hypothetical protein [Candidatus Eremiobacteraeota bacterium]
MSVARVLSTAFACVVLGGVAAACSGSFGSGTNGPVPLGSLQPQSLASATPPPTSSTVVLTYGESTAFQNLPEVGGYSGAVAFPKMPAPTAPPSKGKGSASPAPAPTIEPIAIGATLSTVKPEDGPDLNFVSGKGKKTKHRELPARALAYVKLLPTHDATLESYPRIALDIPRELASQYRDGEFGLALWNSGEKDSAYRLSVAERDTTATPPPIVRTAAPSVTLAPATPSPSPSASGSARPTIAPVATPSAAPTLPPQRILFSGTATPLHLIANRPAIFALYALPHPSSSATPHASPHAGASGAPPSAAPASE